LTSFEEEDELGDGGDKEGDPTLSLRKRVNMKRLVPRERRNKTRRIL
jgi:hypothetical protein